MVRGSPLGERLLRQIVQQFMNNARKKCEKLQSTNHNITQRLRESGEITAPKGQGWKPGVNARTFNPSERNRCQSTQNITASANSSFKNSTKQSRSHISKTSKGAVGPCSSETEEVWKCEMWESTFQIFWKKWLSSPPGLKQKNNRPDCYQAQKSACVMVWGCVSVSCTSLKTPLILSGT